MAPDRQRRASSKGKQTRSTPAQAGRGMGSASGRSNSMASARTSQVIPDAVANRMARRIAIATGLPTLLGMGVFIASYVLVSRHILDIPPSATLLASGGCFLLGLIGLSYGVLSASWEEAPGSVFGAEQIPLNLSRVKISLKALREGPTTSGKGPG
ncbi:MAG: photosystem II biosynthesis protein [Cyanobacteriota bacterium]|jgi:hypothetical protein